MQLTLSLSLHLLHDWLTEEVEIDYIDTIKEKLGKAELSALAGKPVTTVPQVFINGKHIGSFTEMDAFMRDAVTRDYNAATKRRTTQTIQPIEWASNAPKLEGKQNAKTTKTRKSGIATRTTLP